VRACIHAIACALHWHAPQFDRVAESILPLSGLRAVWTNSGLLPEWLTVNPQGLATLNETGGFVCPTLSAAGQLRFLVVSIRFN
jgi:hypothetical protein